MFIGHFALGFAAKRAVPRVSLAALLLAALFADVLWPVLVLLGIEQVRIVPGHTVVTPLEFVSYPWSHSLLLLVGWGVVIGAVYRGIFGGRRSFVVLAALVVSHWVLDWISHAPDMRIYPGGPVFGLLFAAGLLLYTQATRARDAVGQWAFLSLAVLLCIIYVADALRGMPPPSVTVICSVATAASVIVPAWAWWADRHREVRT